MDPLPCPITLPITLHFALPSWEIRSYDTFPLAAFFRRFTQRMHRDFSEYESILRPLSVYITALLYSELSCGFVSTKIVFSGKIVPLNSIALYQQHQHLLHHGILISAINELLSSR